jgi:hypothetical protein
MRFIFFVFALLFAVPAKAGLAEARDLARNYNCQPITAELLSQETGQGDVSIYKVGCALPANATEDEKKANGTLLIACDAALCSLKKKGE